MEKFNTNEVFELLNTKINPQIHSKHDALFLLLHAMMESSGFKLVGLGESDNLIENKQIPPEWNLSQDSWAFRYRHFKSSMTFLLKALRLGSQLLVHALSVEQSQILTLELGVQEYVSDDLNLDPRQRYSNVDKLMDLFLKNIIKKLIPELSDLRQQQQSSTPAAVPSQHPTPAVPSHHPGPVYPGPQPHVPGYPDDPLRIGPPRQPYRGPPFGIGGDDLMGGPGGGFGFIPGSGGPFGGGGSLVGPHHPGFGLPNPYGPSPGRGGGGGGFGFPFPPPPGARFDPYGPPGVRPVPDFDHLPPPGSDHSDDYYM